MSDNQIRTWRKVSWNNSFFRKSCCEKLDLSAPLKEVNAERGLTYIQIMRDDDPPFVTLGEQSDLYE
jgi:hypothetical protein